MAALVEPPRYVPREIQPLLPEQARTLLQHVADHRLGAVVSVATALGLRSGEALGLQWSDISFEQGTLSVRRALERSGGDRVARRPLLKERRELRQRLAAAPKRSDERRDIRRRLEAVRARLRPIATTLHFSEPKSAKSRRTINMPQIVVAALKAHRTNQLKERLAAGADWQDRNLVFTTPLGTPLEARNVGRVFDEMLKECGVPDVHFHDLRQTAATLLLVQGVDPRTMMETLGHSQVSLTLNTYSHVLPRLQGAAAAKMDAILAG